MDSEIRHAIQLPGGSNYPVIGLGTFTISNASGKPGDVFEAVKYAIDVGYRHIDTAYMYGTETEVGDAIQAKLDDKTIKDKKDVFITTKLWVTNFNPNMVRVSALRSMHALKVDSIQLYLMHWPMGFKDGDENYPKDENGKIIYSDHDYLDTWKAMETLVDDKLVENIGVSNFNKKQMERLLQNCRIKPSNSQIEVHPYLSNERIVKLCQDNGVSVTAYAPFANPDRKLDGQPNIFEEPVLQEIASSKKKSIAQIVLRFLLQRNLVVVPKSVTKSRIKDNIDVFDFHLTVDEMKKIFSLNQNIRYYLLSDAKQHRNCPFHDEY